MHVTDIGVIPISHRLPDGQGLGDTHRFDHDRATAFVHVDTDTGEVGWGEAFTPGSAIVPIVDEFFRDDAVGMDLFDVRRLAEESYTDPYHFGESVSIQSAFSGIDVALWDLVGRATGKPIHWPLDGTPRETLTAYASTMYFTEVDRDIATPIRGAVDEGFLAAKIKIGTNTDPDVERVRTARRLLGGDTQLMIDINGSYRSRQVIRAAKAIEEFDITWMEEPVPPENLSSYREVERGVDVPLVAGEAHYGRFEFKRLVDDRTVDVAQSNLDRCGRPSEASHIANLANTKNVVVRLHVWSSAVGLAVAVQFAASVSDCPHARHVPDPMPIEFDRGENPLHDEILKPPFDPTGDEMDVSQTPGPGVKVDEGVIGQYCVDN